MRGAEETHTISLMLGLESLSESKSVSEVSSDSDSILLLISIALGLLATLAARDRQIRVTRGLIFLKFFPYVLRRDSVISSSDSE